MLIRSCMSLLPIFLPGIVCVPDLEFLFVFDLAGLCFLILSLREYCFGWFATFVGDFQKTAS